MSKPAPRKPAGVTVREVASHAGVGLSTVSNAINHPERLAPETLARVTRSIEELGFVRNDAARQLRLGRSRVFGMIVIDAGSPFFAALERAAEDAAVERDYAILLGNSGQEPDRERRYLELFEAQRTQGLLITPLGSELDRLQSIRDRGTPVVLIDYRDPLQRFPSVAVDHVRGGRLAVEHLAEIGRRRIALIEGPVKFAQISDRHEGAISAARALGGIQLQWLHASALTQQGGLEAGRELLSLDAASRPDAVFAPNDMVALGLMEVLHDSGEVAVPGDIAVVGYDDVPFAATARIPLTSLRQPVVDVGRAAIDLMMGLIEDPASTASVSFVPELVVRASTRAPS